MDHSIVSYLVKLGFHGAFELSLPLGWQGGSFTYMKNAAHRSSTVI
jgi:hypothetical protein